jgi:Zn-dependent protease
VVVKSGYLWLGRFRGAPVRLHWTVPLGAVVFTGFRFAPGGWLGFVLLILLHEIGHAIAVAYARQRVVSVDVLGIGGLCRYAGHPTPRQSVLIAWGGVLAQAALLVGTVVLFVGFLGRPTHAFTRDLADVLVSTNMWLIAINLLPIPPLDGAEAWGVLRLIAAERARRAGERERERARVQAAQATARLTARRLDELDDHELPPMPDEVKKVLDRVMAEGRAQHEAERKK